MHGLGYYNLPQALVPGTMVLSDSHLYVSAHGKHFSYIDVEYEDRNWILVYDREDRMPGTESAEQPESKDRDILYALPLNFSQAPTSLAVRDHLLFAAHPNDGVAVISIADPTKPALIRIIKEARFGGQVAPDIIKERAEKMRALGVDKKKAFYDRQHGRRAAVLIESKRDRRTGLLKGLTDNYIPVLIQGDDALFNRLLTLELHTADSDRAMMGKMVGQGSP